MGDREPGDANANNNASSHLNGSKRRVDDSDEEEERHKKKKKKSKDHDRDKDRKHKDRDKDKERDERRRSAGRADSRDRFRESRDRHSYRSSERRHDYRRERSRSPPRHHRDRERERDDRKERPPSLSRRGGADKEEQQITGPKPIGLKDVLAAIPGISMPDAVMRLHAHNSALARGDAPPPLTGSSCAYFPPSSFIALGSAAGLQGEGGSITKPHREVYVGNIPAGVTTTQITDFFNHSLQQLALSPPHPLGSVVATWISPDSHYAFVELRTVAEATAALHRLNGLQLGGAALRIGRPKGYNPADLPPSMAVTMESGPAEEVADALMVSNIPAQVDEDMLRELFLPFGELCAFKLLKPLGAPSSSAQSQPQSLLLQFAQPGIAQTVAEGMHNLDLAGSRISVQRLPASSAAVLLRPSAVTTVGEGSQPAPPTSVVRLSNMAAMEDLTDDVLYEELLEDVADECNKHGIVKEVCIPRPGANTPEEAVGMIYVHFSNVDGARKALSSIRGRRFNGKTVEAAHVSEDSFRALVLATHKPVPIQMHATTSAEELD